LGGIKGVRRFRVADPRLNLAPKTILTRSLWLFGFFSRPYCVIEYDLFARHLTLRILELAPYPSQHYVNNVAKCIIFAQKGGNMEGTRLNKVARQIQKDLGEILQRNSASLFRGKMITVTAVRVSPDLALAKVYISIFPTDKKEDTLLTVKEHTRSLRHELAQRVRHQLRVVPELAFFLDDSLDYIENIDKLLNQ